MEDFAPWTEPDRHTRFSRQELYAHNATDHHSDFIRGERQINADRESFSYMVESERFA